MIKLKISPPPNLEFCNLECFNVLDSKLGARIGQIQWTELASEGLVDRGSWLTVA